MYSPLPPCLITLLSSCFPDTVSTWSSQCGAQWKIHFMCLAKCLLAVLIVFCKWAKCLTHVEYMIFSDPGFWSVKRMVCLKCFKDITLYFSEIAPFFEDLNWFANQDKYWFLVVIYSWFLLKIKIIIAFPKCKIFWISINWHQRQEGSLFSLPFLLSCTVFPFTASRMQSCALSLTVVFV